MHEPAQLVWLKQEDGATAWSLVDLPVAREALLWENVAGGVGLDMQCGRDEWEAVKGAKQWDREEGE